MCSPCQDDSGAWGLAPKELAHRLHRSKASVLQTLPKPLDSDRCQLVEPVDQENYVPRSPSPDEMRWMREAEVSSVPFQDLRCIGLSEMIAKVQINGKLRRFLLEICFAQLSIYLA